MRFYTFVLKNVVRRRLRSSLTVIGMALAVGIVVSLVGVSGSTVQSFLDVYKRQNLAIIVEQKGAKQRLTSVLDERFGDKIAKVPGVSGVNPGMVDYTSIEELGIDSVVIQGWPAGSPLMKNLELEPGGHLPKADETRSVLLGDELATALDKHVGDTIPLFSNGEYKVIGVFKSPVVYESRSMVVLLPVLQRFMGHKGLVSGFGVLVDHPDDEADVHRICDAIMGLGPGLLAKPAAESVRSTTEIRFLRAMAWITSAIAIIIGIVVMLNTMIMSVSERTREIGILRAIGWRQVRIVRMILVEAFLMSLSGGLVGTIGAVGLTRLLGKHPAVAGLVDTHISNGVIGFGIVCALCVGVLGAAYPAFRGARLLPTEALRHE